MSIQEVDAGEPYSDDDLSQATREFDEASSALFAALPTYLTRPTPNNYGHINELIVGNVLSAASLAEAILDTDLSDARRVTIFHTLINGFEERRFQHLSAIFGGENIQHRELKMTLVSDSGEEGVDLDSDAIVLDKDELFKSVIMQHAENLREDLEVWQSVAESHGIGKLVKFGRQAIDIAREHGPYVISTATGVAIGAYAAIKATDSSRK